MSVLLRALFGVASVSTHHTVVPLITALAGVLKSVSLVDAAGAGAVRRVAEQADFRGAAEPVDAGAAAARAQVVFAVANLRVRLSADGHAGHRYRQSEHQCGDVALPSALQPLQATHHVSPRSS